MQSVTASNQKAEVVENTTPFTALTNAGVNVNPHPPTPGQGTDIVANLISNIIKFP